jgi:hypothetical protein
MIPVKSAGIVIVVESTKDLNPETLIFFRRIKKKLATSERAESRRSLRFFSRS